MELFRVYINGEFVDAADGSTFETFDPGNGAPIATVADIAMHAVADPTVVFNPHPPGGPNGIPEILRAAQ